MSNQYKFISVLLLAVISFTCFSCAGNCGYESGARVTPAFVAASGSKVYIHPPKDKTLADRFKVSIELGLEDLGFKVVDDPGSCDLMAYYFYSYDWDQPAYIRDFMIVFKPYPGDQPELLASASCYHRCSSSFTQDGGQEVRAAFNALSMKYQAAVKNGK